MTICRSGCEPYSNPVCLGALSLDLRQARCALPRLLSRHARTEPAMSVAMRALCEEASFPPCAAGGTCARLRITRRWHRATAERQGGLQNGKSSSHHHAGQEPGALPPLERRPRHSRALAQVLRAPGLPPPSQDCYVLALDVPLRVLPEGHRCPGGGVERAPAPCLEREVEDRVLLLLERADLPFEVDLLVEGEHHAGEFLLPAEMTTVLLGDADGELVGGGARILALSPRRAAPRGRLVEVVWFVKRTAGPRGPRPYTGSSAGRASARATSCRRGSP